MVRLGVVVDQIAVIRAERRGKEPDPISSAIQVEMGGADGIVATLRDDRKFITDRDINLLKEIINTHFNVRLAVNDDMIRKAVSIVPDMVTLIPSIEQEALTREGVDVVDNYDYLVEIIGTLHASNIVVCARIEPDVKQVKAIARAGADYVELNTFLLSQAQDLNEQTEELEKLRSIAMAANKLGLGVSAGGGLNYQNIKEIIKIPQIEEVNIGYAIICRALMVGIERAVQDMTVLLREMKSNTM